MNPTVTAVPESAAHHSNFPNQPVHHHDPQGAAIALAQEEAAQKERQHKLKALRTHLYVGGRVLLAGLFITSALAKALDFGGTREAMVQFGLTGTTMLLAAAIALELICGVMLAVGYKARAAAVGLLIYLAVVTFAVHGDLSIGLNRAFALANVAFAGGLLMVIGHGAGTFSLDKRRDRHGANR